jgi:hypothetical protein
MRHDTRRLVSYTRIEYDDQGNIASNPYEVDPGGLLAPKARNIDLDRSGSLKLRDTDAIEGKGLVHLTRSRFFFRHLHPESRISSRLLLRVDRVKMPCRRFGRSQSRVVVLRVVDRTKQTGFGFRLQQVTCFATGGYTTCHVKLASPPERHAKRAPIDSCPIQNNDMFSLLGLSGKQQHIKLSANSLSNVTAGFAFRSLMEAKSSSAWIQLQKAFARTLGSILAAP